MTIPTTNLVCVLLSLLHSSISLFFYSCCPYIAYCPMICMIEHNDIPCNDRAEYGNPNVIKLSKFKFKGVKVQNLYMEGCKRSKLQTHEGCKCTELHIEGCKRSNPQTQLEWTGVAN